MNVNDGTDLEAMHQAITDVSAAAFPGVHFEFYRQDRKNLPLGNGVDHPSAYGLLSLMEFEPGDTDPGTEQQALTARFEAEFVIKSLQAGAKIKVRTLAGSFAAFLRKQSRWPGVLSGPAHVMGCFRDDFSPELDQYEVWRVEWSQEVFLGTGVWGATGELPQQVLFSFVPVVGVPFEPDYQDITGEPRT